MVKWLWVPIFIGMMAFFQIDPAEDPHIIFRYAENLAEGRGIVFNDTPVEGATEFLWMIILSGFHLLGFNLPAMSQVLNGLLALGILYVLHKRNAHPVIMAFSPIVIWVLSGFGTPLFALLALLMFTSAIDKTHNATVIFGLLLGLARPEGLFLFVGVAIVNRIPIKYFSWFIIGAIYYLWRLDYFGYPFPNTFYVKHAGKFFHAEGIKATVILLVTVAFLFPKRNKLLIPLLVFPLLYLITDQSQNIGMRFQFSILPSILLFVPQRKWSYLAILPMLFIYMGVNPIKWERLQSKTPLDVVSTIAHPDSLWVFRSDADTHFDERKYLGEEIWRIGRKGTAIVTEAGWFPYYSKLKAIDAVGLNDSYIAHNGLDTAYLSKHKPDMIMFRSYNSDFSIFERGDTLVDWGGTPHWNRIVQTLYLYALTHDFQLIHISGSRRDCIWWFARN